MPVSRSARSDDLGALEVPGYGWTCARIRMPGQTATHRAPTVHGLIDPGGVAWERWSSSSHPGQAALREELQRVRHLQLAGQRVVRVQVDGAWWLAERPVDPAAGPQPWWGLDVAGTDAWLDKSAAGMPWQHYLGATWTAPSCAPEAVTLYLRWRWTDPWTGRVFRAPLDPRGLGDLIDAPGSPNLLPTGKPRPAESLTSLLVRLVRFQTGRDDELPGYAEADFLGAAAGLVAAAETWLLQVHKNESAWEVRDGQ